MINVIELREKNLWVESTKSLRHDDNINLFLLTLASDENFSPFAFVNYSVFIW